MNKLLLELLHERRQTKKWLADGMGISKQLLNEKLKRNYFTFKEWLKIIDVFGLNDDEILSYIHKAREDK